MIQLGIFLTPVADTASLVPSAYRPLYGLNPVAGVLEGFRWALLDSDAPDWGMMAVFAGVVLVSLVGRLFDFRWIERTFAELV